jgi:alanyl-tRNA synthetase
MNEKIKLPLSNDVWEKMGPYSCQLNIDEVENIEKTWSEIA